MTRRLRRMAMVQATTIKKKGVAITGPSHGISSLRMIPTEMGVSRKKLSSNDCGLHDA